MTATATTSPAAEVDTRRLVAVGAMLGVISASLIVAADPDRGVFMAVPLIGAAMIAVIDQKTGRIANRHSTALFAVTMLSLGVGSLVGDIAFRSVLLGVLVWAVPFFVMAFAGRGGGGDFKLAASLGGLCASIMLSTAVIGLMVALLACCVAGLVVARRERTMAAKLHLGLPLFVGTVATILVSL